MRPHWLPPAPAVRNAAPVNARRWRRAMISRHYYRSGLFWGVFCGALWGLFIGAGLTAAALRMGMGWGV